MFDLFRSREKSVRVVLGVLLGLVAISMLLYLIPGGLGNGGNSGDNTTVATVGSDKITTLDVQRALQTITRGQQNLPKSILGMYAPMIVNQMIEGKAMAYKARQLGLRISDQELGDTIQSEFASQMGGKFDMSIYQNVLAQQGMSAKDFEERQRESMLATRLENLEAQSLVVSDADARAEYQRKNLKVGLKYIAFQPADFKTKVKDDPPAVKAYFDKNRSLFRIPEKRNVELVYGTTAQFVQGAQVAESALRKEYDDNIDSYRQPERVQVRHILIKTQGKPKEEIPKLKAKAEDILKQLQGGANFADLAKKNSDDPGSAEKGGELGFIVRGQTVPNFEKTAFSLQPGQLSGVIETEYGYHILQLESKQPAHTQSFEEVRPQLLAELQKQVAAENLKHAVETAHAQIAKSPAQASAIAAKYGLKYVHLDNFQSGGTLPDIGSAPELSGAIFGASNGAVTDVVDTEAQKASGFAYVRDITPARNAEFSEVEKDVIQKYKDSEAEHLAQDAAKSAAERASKGESLETIAKSYGLSVKTAAPFTQEGAAEGIGAANLLSAAFQDKVGAIVGPVNSGTGTFVCEVSEKIPADMNQFAKDKQSVIESLQQQRRTVQQPLFRDSVVSELKRKGKIKIYQDTLNRLVGSLQS